MIALLLLSTNVRAEIASGTCNENISWTLSDVGVLKIVGNGDMPDYDMYMLGRKFTPWYEHNEEILKVEIGEGITSIGEQTFLYVNNITSISIPSTVKIIKDCCIGSDNYGDRKINIYITDFEAWCNTEISNRAFTGYNNTPTSRRLYFNKKELKDIVVPNTITKIRRNTFCNTKSITSVDIPNSVTDIETSAFSRCVNLNTVMLPSGLTNIEDGLFYECSNLTSINIPNRVTSIGNNTFYGCRGLTSINIPKGVMSMGDCIFYQSGLTTINIPDGVTSIGSAAFENCEALVSVVLPGSVTTIGEDAFRYCKNLTSINLPDGITSIGAYAFYGCTFEEVTIPSSCLIIPARAFSANDKLKTIMIPSTCILIKATAFSGCGNIENIYCYAETPPVLQKAFSNYNACLHIPDGTYEAYKAEEEWAKFSNILVGGKRPDPTPKCEIPTIEYVNGEILLSCATPGAICTSNISCPDVNAYVSTNSISLNACYNIAAVAKADGYEPSEVATATIYWLKNSGSIATDIKSINTRGIMVNAADGVVTVRGLVNNETVTFYTTGGQKICSVKAIGGTASCATSENIVVAKVGEQSISIMNR